MRNIGHYALHALLGEAPLKSGMLSAGERALGRSKHRRQIGPLQ